MSNDMVTIDQLTEILNVIPSNTYALVNENGVTKKIKLESLINKTLNEVQLLEIEGVSTKDKTLKGILTELSTQYKDIANITTITNLLETKKLNRNEQNSISMGMLTTEVKKSMTNGSVAVVGVDSVGYLQLSKNIQSDIEDISDISSASYNNYSADIVSDKVSITTSIYYKHQIFDVTEGEKYNIKLYTQDNTNAKYIIFCDDSLNVTGTEVKNISENSLKSVTVTIPAGSTKMYINTASGKSINVAKYVYSPIATKKDLNISQESIQNKFKRDTIEELQCDKYDSAYNNINGVATLGTSVYYKSVIANCTELDKVYVSLTTIANPNVNFVYFTDNDLNIIGTELSNQKVTKYTDHELIVPSGATKVIVNSDTNHGYPYVKAYKIVTKCVDLDELKGIEDKINKSNDRMEILEKSCHTIPSYYLDYIDNKIKEINSFEKQYGCDGDTFIFITDVHIGDNTMQSPKIIQEIVKKTNVKKIICGGDLITAFPQTEESIYKQAYDYINAYRNIHGANVYTIPGNHDIMGFKGQTTGNGTWNISDDERYSIAFKSQEDYINTNIEDLKNVYFYIDNKAQKIRYICTNMFSQDSTQPSDVQIEWIKNVALKDMDKTWNVVFFSHAGLTTTTGDGWSNTTPQAQSLKTLIENARSTTNIVGHFAGHLHKDLHDLQNGINHISTACDAFYADDNVARTVGTVNEICFDVVCINKKSKKINCVRIGAGNNREFTY